MATPTNTSPPHKLEGKLQRMFEIPQTVINILHQELHQLYTTSSFKNPVTPEKVHKIVLSLFTHHYYPHVSRSIHADNYTQPIIMGGIAFNMNVPAKMAKLLEIPTDDIDLKVYTTEINYLDKKPAKVSRVLSIFRFMVLIICMYMKQISVEVVKYTDSLTPIPSATTVTPTTPKTSQTQKAGGNKNKNKKHNKKTKKSQLHKPSPTQLPKEIYQIQGKQIAYGMAKGLRAFIVLKKKTAANESIDISSISYEDAFKLVMEKIDDPDYLITNKMLYVIKYVKPMTIPVSRMKITFSDSKIIYPTVESPAFYSYYLMNRGNNPKTLNASLEQLIKQDIKIKDILESKPCRNNCSYISVNSLLMDICLMLSYAELLVDENIESNPSQSTATTAPNILVPIGSVFKYEKYFTKFIRLHIIRKYYNGTLTVKFIEPAKRLMRYIKSVLGDLSKETREAPEDYPVNLFYKKVLSQFHQDFFMRKTLINDYPELAEVVETYDKNVKYINKSRAKFKPLDDKSDTAGETIESISIQFADKKESEEASRQSIKSAADMQGGGSRNSIVMYGNEDEDISRKRNKNSKKNNNMNSIMNTIIGEKLIKMLDNEIKFLDSVKRHI